MSTPPSSIEEVAKRVKELAEGGGLLGVDRRTGEEYDLRTLARQLAEWVEKMVPVIEAANDLRPLGMAFVNDDLPEWVRVPRVFFEPVVGLLDDLANLATPSSLAAEGTTE